MDRIPMSSSNIKSAGYDEGNSILEIEFKDGNLYQYFNVPLNIWENFKLASSKGKFFAFHVKEKFRYRKISQ